MTSTDKELGRIKGQTCEHGYGNQLKCLDCQVIGYKFWEPFGPSPLLSEFEQRIRMLSEYAQLAGIEHVS